MIIPTAEYDPMFADDGVPFQEKMVAYIEREFSDILDQRALAAIANCRPPACLPLIKPAANWQARPSGRDLMSA